MKVPKIRFKGENSNYIFWKFEILFSYASEWWTPDTNNKNFYLNWDIPFVKIEDTENKYIKNTKSFITKEWLKHSSAWLIPSNNIIFTNGATVWNVAINKIPVATKQGILWIIPNKNIDKEYMYYLLSNTHFQNEVKNRTAKWTFETIILRNLKEIPISLPSLPEQEKIWSLFEQLDSHISKNQQKLEKLKNMKQSFLQKLFPKDWSALPELRFKGFEGAWEERKFWNIVKLCRWLTYNPDNIEKDWIRVLRSSNILEDCFRIEEDDVFVNVNAININYASNWNILITAANWSPRLVWKHTIIKWIKENTTVHWWFMLLWETKNPNFINSSMWSTWYKKFLWLYVSWWNWAIGNLNKNSLENYMFYIPKKEEEQEKIWAFFEKLDTQITQQTQKIQKLQNLKQSLLEKMFI